MIVSATELRIVLSTASSDEEAGRIARGLVERGLAACVNLVPGVTSVYRWRGELETADEVLLVIKTTSPQLQGVEAELRRLHSYELPEFVVLTPEGGSQAYLEWVSHCVTGSAQPEIKK